MSARLFYFSLGFFGCCLYLPAQPCQERIEGRVLNELGTPMVTVSVAVASLHQGAVTDSLGQFTIRNLCAGEYMVQFRHLGYRPQTVKLGTGGTDAFLIIMESESGTLKEIIVHEEHDHLEGIQNYTILGEKQLSESAGKALGEVLKEIPGVSSIQTGPGIFKPVIHGVHSQRVLILNHGIRQEGQQWGAEHAPEIDPFIASNILVIKDASAIKYGTDALGGVIVVNPAPLPDRPGLGGSLSTVVQSNGRQGAVSGMLEGGIRNALGWGWRVHGTARGSGDFHAPDYSLTNTGIRELDFSATTGYHKGAFGAEIFFSRFQTELGILRGSAVSNLNDLLRAMEQEPPQGTTDFSYTLAEPRQEVSHNLLKMNAHWVRPTGSWRIQYGYQSNFRREFDLRVGGLSKIPAIDLQLITHTLEVEWEKHTSTGHQFTLGANGMYQDNQNVPGTQRIPFIPNYTNISGGPFAVAKLNLNQWMVDIGARFDFRNYDVIGYDFKNTVYTADLRFSNVSMTAGAIRPLGKTQTLKLNVSSAWRPPHVAELYSLGTHQSAAAIEYGLLLNDSTNEVMKISDVPFKVEKAWKAVVTHQHTGRRFQVETTLYANFIQNYIYLRPTGVTQNIRGVYPYFRYTQTDALFLGADISASMQASSRVTISSKVSLLSASDFQNNDFLVFIPSNRFELAVRYSATGSNFYVEPKVKYVSQQYRAPRVITVREIQEGVAASIDPLSGSQANFDFMAAPDGYALASLAAGISLPSGKGRFDFRMAVENAMNTSYREYTNRFRYYADDIGRNVIFSVKYIF
ncbi:MAG: TonB-dependent receptor [Cytophagales bacterium]|nr:TonB-dependent receptor [Cytophagales bacterium]